MKLLFLVIIVVGILFFIGNKEAKKEHDKNMIAYNNSWQIMINDEVDDAILSVIEPYTDTEKSYNFIYKYEDMPLGRAAAFLNYHNVTIFDEEPYIFLCKRSSKDNEFREYVCIIGRRGIYYCKDNPQNSSLKEKEDALPGKDEFYPYAGLAKVSCSGTKLRLTYIRPNSKTDEQKRIVITDNNERELILRVLNQVVNKEIGFAYYKGNVLESVDDIQNTIDRVFGNNQNALNYYRKTFKKTENAINQTGINVGIGTAGIQSSQPQFNAFYAENKNYMNGSRGHGYAAEYGNNAVDRFLLKHVENVAQNLENGHQVKNGADRKVNGIEIQTKYYRTASESIGAAFEHKQAKYIRTDGTGKMMPIEVPRDQYQQALELMQKRIDSGQVPGVEPGEDAHNYVKKGYFTYDQSFCIAQSGTIESLTVDAISGAVCCMQAAGITAVIVFAMSLWSGVPLKEALKQSLGTSLKVLGQGTLIYTLTMQLSRDSFANIFSGKHMVNGASIGYNTIKNPIFAMSENLATKIGSSNFAKSSIGKSLGLENISGKQIVGGAVTVVVVFGPDIARAMTGRISTKQLAKNATVGVAGIAGAALGQAIIPIPVVGGMIGGGLTSFITKKTLDHFVEDDAKEMFRILKEEFLDTTILAGLNAEEFEKVVQLTVGHKKISKQFQKMYQSQDFRNYARNVIMMPAINEVLSNRNVICNSAYDDGLKLLTESNGI